MRPSWDTVIVGAGIMGALIQDHLRTLRPDASVLVLDRSVPAAGATGRSAGLCLPLADTPGRAELVRSSHDYLRRQADRFGARMLRPVEMWFVTTRPSRDRLAARWIGSPLRTVGRGDLETAYAGLRLEPDEIVSASSGDCFAVDAGRLAWCLLDAGNATVWDGCTVVGVQPRADRVEVRMASGATVVASSVVLATGGWPLPVDRSSPTWPAKRIAALQVDHAVPTGTPIVDFLDDEVFLMPVPGGPLTVSFRRTAWAGAGADRDLATTQDDIAEGRAALRRRAPQLADRVVGARAAYDGYPDSGEPVVAAIGDGRVVVAGGMGGSGVRLGPAVARRAASLVAAVAGVRTQELIG
jgi:glycine/D-amino acid oxidase-like deaminating enzyme